MLAATNAGMLGVLLQNGRNAEFANLAGVAITECDELLPYLSPAISVAND
jgi:hypothetical protein